ncbi:unnamed protein product [Anisakis simplex]|uniref:Transposase n=1 Tax=Anisakis simplex TaxID=6269 RepID=A0A0M3JI82_ANISI|nr:unnamed protein product [Anisakis simplex]
MTDCNPSITLMADDDLDYLLGVTTQPKVNKPLVTTDKNESLRTSKNQNVVSNVNSDGWDDDATGGWDDFGSDAKSWFFTVRKDGVE